MHFNTESVLIDRACGPSLKLLLRSLPSNQLRPDLALFYATMEEQTPRLTDTDALAVSDCGSSMKEDRYESFTRLDNAKTGLTCGPKESLMAPSLREELDAGEETETTVTGDQDDDHESSDMEVEFMIFAQKGGTHMPSSSADSPSNPLSPRKARRSKDQPSTPRKKKSSNYVSPPTTPPEIKHRRKDVLKLEASSKKKKEKKSKGCPGFK